MNGAWAYYNVADELSDPRTTLDDLDRQWLQAAEDFADGYCLPWPPSLGAADRLLEQRRDLFE